ncbi:helix-turn-helix transcriptional regulator [Roseateles cellulosilyticus]|uniref:LuxR C-terminal-related transcriptional regulator n=1 Tax=Pelomonas cellulosilytica TaxID=2906762 RepID=A0ABS8XYK7_9BURK|nr:LuxR C-terminal-related transcriptional regulator [Pelomonas sp. P8]MCE4555824.1 LuxR C-terminal-related transcriptional regulator [Pelomonas sp. P8]
MNYQQLIDVGLSEDLASFERRLVATADAMGFPIISGALMRGLPKDGEVQGLSFGNTPAGHAEAYKDLGETLRDPVFDRLMAQPLPVVYDQATYTTAGVGELWETQAPYGYKTGIAVKLQLGAGDKQFLLGVDREEPLPELGAGLTQLIGGLQLLAVHAMTAADRLLGRRLDVAALPKLTKRELDVLSWTAQGKTAWEVSVILGMSEKTVNFHLGNVMRKLEVNSKHQAVLKCMSAGLL